MRVMRMRISLHDMRAFAGYHLTPSGVAHHSRHRWQRMWRGWSDSDNWSADWYWTRIIVEMMEAQSAKRFGHPACFTSEEWWDGIVAPIIRAFRLHLWIEDEDWRWRGITDEDRATDAAEFDKALSLLVQYWHAFWI
jgi:hypothetical protein